MNEMSATELANRSQFVEWAAGMGFIYISRLELDRSTNGEFYYGLTEDMYAAWRQGFSEGLKVFTGQGNICGKE